MIACALTDWHSGSSFQQMASLSAKGQKQNSLPVAVNLLLRED